MKIRISLVLEEGDLPHDIHFTLPDGQQVTLTPERAQVDLDASGLSETQTASDRKTLSAKPK